MQVVNDADGHNIKLIQDLFGYYYNEDLRQNFSMPVSIKRKLRYFK